MTAKQKRRIQRVLTAAWCHYPGEEHEFEYLKTTKPRDYCEAHGKGWVEVGPSGKKVKRGGRRRVRVTKDEDGNVISRRLVNERKVHVGRDRLSDEWVIKGRIDPKVYRAATVEEFEVQPGGVPLSLDRPLATGEDGEDVNLHGLIGDEHEQQVAPMADRAGLHGPGEVPGQKVVSRVVQSGDRQERVITVTPGARRAVEVAFAKAWVHKGQRWAARQLTYIRTQDPDLYAELEALVTSEDLRVESRLADLRFEDLKRASTEGSRETAVLHGRRPVRPAAKRPSARRAVTPVSTTIYDRAKALLELDYADEPDKLERAVLFLDQKRRASFVESGGCANCGRQLQPRQVMYCSPQCANEEAVRDDAVRQAVNEATRTRWADEDAAAVAAKTATK